MLTVAALILLAGLQAPAPQRSEAEGLARAGRTAEAMAIFARIVETNPADVEARLWVARLALRLGHIDEAETGFRAVLREHPADIDAQIGLGMVLTRQGRPREALATLTAIEAAAGENADLLGALARAYRRAGDDRLALEYFGRAQRLAPDDPDLALGFEAVARTYGHWVDMEGFGQWGAEAAHASAERIATNLRVAPRLHVEAGARLRQGSGYSDAVAGGGIVWQAPRATAASFRIYGGSGNTSLPAADVAGDAVHYAGAFEAGGGIRWLSFDAARVVAVSPVFAWDRGRWRFDTRYTYSRSTFEDTGTSSGDHSILLRETWQAWRRTAIFLAYAHGIESFEDLTSDRLGSLGATTIAAGLRIDTPSLTRITATWEREWRSNDTKIHRVTVSILQFIP